MRAASIASRDGLQIGPGGRPPTSLVLYGELVAKSWAVIVLSSFVYRRVASASSLQPLSRRFQRIPATVLRSSAPNTSFSMIEAIVMISLNVRGEFAICSRYGSIFVSNWSRALYIA